MASTARWWFVPHWHKGSVADWKATTFNAKLETAAEKPTFRTAWATGRCLIPARGYFEWTGAKGQKLPWFVAPQTNENAFFFAGLTSQLADGMRSCTILTRAADDSISHLHPRMPVMLRDDQVAPWLDHSAPDDEVIDSFGTGWTYRTHRVAKFGIKDDGPELIEPEGFDFG